MKAFTRLYIVILCASLLPCVAILSHTQARRSDESSLAALRLALISDLKRQTSDSCNAWLRENGGSKLAPMVRSILQPDMVAQLDGRVGKAELLQALQAP